jgi:hypothetical protein
MCRHLFFVLLLLLVEWCGCCVVVVGGVVDVVCCITPPTTCNTTNNTTSTHTNNQYQHPQAQTFVTTTQATEPTANTNTHKHACKAVPGSVRCVAEFLVGASEDKFIGKQKELSCCRWGGHCLG